MLAHKATHEARVAVEALAGRRTILDPRAIPAVVFTDPKTAWCNLTETQAAAEGRAVRVAKFPWTASGRIFERPDEADLSFDKRRWTHTLPDGPDGGSSAEGLRVRRAPMTP